MLIFLVGRLESDSTVTALCVCVCVCVCVYIHVCMYVTFSSSELLPSQGVDCHQHSQLPSMSLFGLLWLFY